MTPQKTIILVRHGQTDNTKPPEDKLGNSLTRLGIEQAQLTGRRLAGLPVTTIHHSTARRAKETAEVIAANFPGVPLLADPLLLECIPAYPPTFIEWYRSLSPEQLAQAGEDLQVPPEMSLWLGMREPGTEWSVMEEDLLQAQAAFEKYFTPAIEDGEHELIVCHGNIIRYFMVRVLQAPPELWINADINNCGICDIILGGDRKMQLISFNDTGHLPGDMRVFF